MSDSGKLFPLISTALVLVALGAGLYVSGSPGKARLLRQDERRIEALQRARTAVDNHYWSKAVLPTLTELNQSQGDSTWFHDFERGTSYEYTPITDSTYQLCADFARENHEGRDSWNAEWNHPAGHHCFDRSAKPSTARTAP